MNESILDSDLDIIIKAGAGCGKTKILVDRYLAELRKESDGLYVGVDRLAAITFTEKAAEELQSRLRDKITEEIEKLSATFLDSSSNSLIGSSANLEASISATNQEHGLLLNLIRQRQGLASGYISTIHSFCARILKENSIAARVNPDFTIIDPISAYKLRHDAIKELILKRLLANDSIIKSWVANCGFEKPTGLISQIAKIAAIIRLSNQDSQSIHKSYAAIVEKLAASSDCSKVNIDSMIDSLRFINEDNKRIKIQYAEELLKLKEPLLAGLELDKIGDAIGLVSKLQSHIKRHEEKLSTDDIDKIKSAIKIIRTSVDKRIEVDTSNSFKAIVSLIFDAEKLYQFKKSVTGELDYDDLEIFTLNLIKHNNEIRDALQKKFVKIMVDEFQDTNDLQNELISYLAPFGSGKLFVVGDRKQAIYQFRGSNVELFDSIAKEASISSNSLFYLNRNYRSNEQIINFCNLLVKDISKGDRNENELDLLTPASPASEGKSNGEIRIVQGPLDATTVDKVREQEANYIVKLIDDAVTNHTMTVYDKTISSNRAVRYSDFGILFRAFSDINIYERAFKRAAIPYELFGGGEFFNAPEVVDFLNLLTFIENRYDKLAFLATLRSPFVALSDQTLLELTIASDGTLIDHDSYLTKEKEPLITDKSELVEFNRFIDLYLRWEELAGRLLLSELMEEVLRESGYNSILLGNEFGFRQLANIHKLIEKGRKFETGSILTLSEFLDDCNLAKQSEKETSANIYKSDNMVSILTVHSAKGLEFPIIILANIAAKAPTYSAPINFSSRSGLGVKWFNQLTDSWLEPYSYRLIKDEQKSASDDEELRVLYVAMTRACDHLIILLPDHLRHKSAWVKQIAVLAKKGSDIITQDSYSSATPTLREIDPIVEEPLETLNELLNDKISKKSYLPLANGKKIIYEGEFTATLLATYMAKEKEHALVKTGFEPRKIVKRRSSSSTSSTSLELGIKIHNAIATCDLHDLTNIEAKIQKKLSFLKEKSIQKRVSKRIKNVFNSLPLSSIAQASVIKQESSFSFLIEDDEVSSKIHAVIDLYFIADDRVHIVDYKYSKATDNQAYKMQLLIYGYGLARYYGKSRVDAHLVFLNESGSDIVSYSFLMKDFKQLEVSVISTTKELLDIESAKSLI